MVVISEHYVSSYEIPYNNFAMIITGNLYCFPIWITFLIRLFMQIASSIMAPTVLAGFHLVVRGV